MSFLNLTKSLELNLAKKNFPAIPVMQTRLALDKSGSMDHLYSSGWVNAMVERFYAAAMKFDDNHQLDVGAFNSKFTILPTVCTQAEASSYTTLNRVYASGGTEFAGIFPAFGYNNQPEPSIVDSVLSLFAKKKKVIYPPIFLGIITDGDNDDEYETDTELQLLIRNADTFVQFYAIGKSFQKQFIFDLAKKYKNVDVIRFETPNVSNDEFYNAMCSEKFKTWLENR